MNINLKIIPKHTAPFKEPKKVSNICYFYVHVENFDKGKVYV